MKTAPPSAASFAPSPARAVTVVQITDPTAVGEGIEVLQQDAVKLRPEPLRARRVIVRLGACTLLSHSTNLPIRSRTVLRSGLVAFAAFGPRASGTVNGLSVGPGRVLASASGIEAEFVVAGGYESVSLLLPPEQIRAQLRRQNREEHGVIPQGIGLLQTTPAAASGLYDWARRVVDTAASNSEVFDEPQANSAAETELIETVLRVLGSAVEAERTSQDVTRQGHSRIVQVAEDYALTRPAIALYVTDLCEAAGVSERTLQYAFTRIMGMTPVAYLTRLRLHRVRQALRAATHASTTVSAEAMKWGFWHFGDFSKGYKDCFGELPSDTLQRNPGAQFREMTRGRS